MKTIGKKIETTPMPAQEPASKVVGTLSKADNEEPLKLPKGAIVVMRKSGGLRFTAREVAVHRDGQITQSSTGLGITSARSKSAPSSKSSKSKKKPGKLTKKQISDLRLTIAKSMAGADATMQVGRAQQNPDAYAYEIVTRVGRKVQSVEVFDGSIPESLQPLIRELSGYLIEV